MANYSFVSSEAERTLQHAPTSIKYATGRSSEWTDEEGQVWAVQVRQGIGQPPRNMHLRVGPTTIELLEPETAAVVSTHPYTRIRTYQADTGRHSFAWQEIDADGETTAAGLHEVYVRNPKRLHHYVTDTVQALSRKIKAEKEARKAKKAADQARRDAEAALAAAHPPPIAPPPGGTRARAPSASSKHPPQISLVDPAPADDVGLDTLLAASSPAAAAPQLRLSPMVANARLRERRSSLADALERRPSLPDLMGSSVMRSPEATLPFRPSDVRAATTAAPSPPPPASLPPPLNPQVASVAHLENSLRRRPSMDDVAARGILAADPVAAATFRSERRASITNHLLNRPPRADLVDASILDDDDAFFAALKS